MRWCGWPSIALPGAISNRRHAFADNSGAVKNKAGVPWGERYGKALVLSLELSQPNEITSDLLAAAQPTANEKLKGGLDVVGTRWGRGCGWRASR